jgi:hypothetical protein
VIVLDVRDSTIKFTQPFVGNAGMTGVQAGDNWPMKNWGAEFPVSMESLGDCVNPSGK